MGNESGKTRRGLLTFWRSKRTEAPQEEATELVETTRSSLGHLLEQKFTRRDGLKLAAASALAYAGLAASTDEVLPNSLQDILDEKKVRDQMDFLETRYDCQIDWDLPWYNAKFSLEEKKEILALCRKELAKYPPDYIRSIKLRIVFVNYQPSSLDGKAEPPNYIVIFNPLDGDGSRTLHHELEHIMDFNDNPATCDDGELDFWCNFEADNPRWVELNPDKGMAYVGEQWKQDSDVAVSTGQRSNYTKGFTRNYGKKNPDEDQAEVAAHLMSGIDIDPNIRIKDPILFNKIQEMKERMAWRSNGRMNKQYWKDLEAGKIDEEYWDSAA